MSTPTSIKLYDLISSARAGKLRDVVERDTELARLARVLVRPNHHHAILVAEPGSGKSSLIDALAVRLQAGHYAPLEPKLYRLGTDAIMSLLVNGDSLKQCADALRQATSKLEVGIIVIEDIQLLAADDPGRLELTLQLIQALASHQRIRIVATTTSSAFHRVFRDDYLFNRSFEAIELAEPSSAQVVRMVEAAAPDLERADHTQISTDAITQAVHFGGRFGHGRALPDAAIRLLEDTAVKVSLSGRDTILGEDIKDVVAERERLPLADLQTDQREKLSRLEPALMKAVIGQPYAMKSIAQAIARSQLGLGDPSKPRASFLLLGPSGVGKTETAKALAAEVYSNPNALVRLDMSEYGEAHAAVRLVGSPPGYVGYEEGGQLTGAVAREPYSLVLLDEIEKAHPKVFDLFLQLLDDGRLTDSSGQTVDFTQTLVLATSNCASAEITTAVASGANVHAPAFMQDVLLPLLLKSFRPEFINRFDAILVYKPLGRSQLIALAQRELSQLEQRLSRLGVRFDVDPETIAAGLLPGYNPMFGARPVKRFIATHYETPIANRLVHGGLTGPVTITGTEDWLAQEVIV